MHDKDEIHTFDHEALWSPWAVAYDSSLVASLLGAIHSFRLTDVEDLTVRKPLIDNYLHGISSASAWEAPLIAFATRQDARVRWFGLRPDAIGA